MILKETQIRRFTTLVNTLSASNFYGSVITKFEGGNIVHITLQPTILLKDLLLPEEGENNG